MRTKKTKITDNCNTTQINFKSISWRYLRSIVPLVPTALLPILLLIQNVDASTSTANTNRQHKVHNPAMDAKACVKLVQDTKRSGANISGNWRMTNNCNFPIEFFWCETNVECGRTGNTWTIGAGRGWPLSGHDFRWGACKGKNSGSFDKDSAGRKYTCPNLQ